jgi:recombination protein RecA
MARRRIVQEPAVEPALPPKNPLQKVFADIAARSKSFRPAREVLRRVRAVPTIFPVVDWKMQVGGWPTERVAVIHGPESNGKTVFSHGIGLSFLRRGHLYSLVDAEMTTPIDWCEQLMGGYASSGAFTALRPRSYEQAVDGVRAQAEAIAEQREKGRLSPDTTCLFVIDSIRKLVPEDIQARIRKSGAEGADGSVDGFSGAAGRMRAALNAAWLDELVPLMHDTRCAIAFIGRESDDPTADARDRQFGNDWKLTGGRGMRFDSSMTVRIVRSGFTNLDPSDKKSQVVGQVHRVEIRKTKVAANEDRVDVGFFHTSNGKQSPEGFDRARDVLMLADEMGVTERKGTWLSFGGTRWQGERKFVETVRPDTLDSMEGAARAAFKEKAEKRGEVVG